jgi:ribokinase
VSSPAPAPSVAVVGHVEHVEFVPVDRVPRSGEIAHAGSGWSVAAGGGAVAAVQLGKLAGGCRLLTVLGDDELGHRCAGELADLGVTVDAVFEGEQRRAITFVEPTGERTITTIGPKLAPRRAHALDWDALDGLAAVFFGAGDPDALRAARGARVLTATSRELPVLVAGGVQLDALIGSARDPAEHYERGAIDPEPAAVVRTEGARGGSYETVDGGTGRWAAEPSPGPVGDTYGCGDSFAAAVTFALGRGEALTGALALGARAGAACLTGHGPYAGQLDDGNDGLDSSDA